MTLIETLIIKLTSSDIEDKKVEYFITGFYIKYNDIVYLISVHHFLPINKITIDENECDIKINSNWSEILILLTNNLCYDEYVINENLNFKIPSDGTKLNIKFGSNTLKIKKETTGFIPYNNFPSGYKTIYIIASCDEKIETPNGLSGAPVFNKNKLIGIITKYDVKNKIFFIIPIYFVIKNLLKNDNNNIYYLPIDYKKSKITKIQNFKNNSSNYIFHSILNIFISYESYYLIEGDDNLNIVYIVDKEKKNETFIRLKNLIPNEKEIIKINDEYIVNYRLLTLIRHLDLKEFIKSLIDILMRSNENDELNITLKYNKYNKEFTYKII